MIYDYFLLAFRNLKKRGLRSWLTLLGIVIGVTAVVSLISLGTGLQTAITSQFGISSTEVITVQAGGLSFAGPPGSAVSKPLTINDLKAIEKLGTVKKAIRRNIVSGKIEFKDKVIFGFVTNIPSGEERKIIYKIFELKALKGRLLGEGDKNKVVLGYNFYADKVGLGKSVKLGDKILIQDKSFKVVGFTKRKGSFLFDNVIYVDSDSLKNLIGYGDKVDLIAVIVKNKDLIDKAKKEIENLLRKRRNVKKGEEDFKVSTPQASLETVNNVVGGVQVFVAIIALISVIVGAIGITNTMIASVLERKKEIGIMKAVGARNSQIFSQFLVESGFLGLVGGIVGAVLGTAIGFFGTIAINNFVGATVGIDINFALIFTALAGSFLIGAIAGIVPAMNAAKQNPVEALRG